MLTFHQKSRYISQKQAIINNHANVNSFFVDYHNRHNKDMRRSYLLFFWCLGLLLAMQSQINAQKYICHGLGNLSSEDNNGISIMNKMVANGCNSVMLTVWWERVYPQPNSKPNWVQLDNQINHAINNLGIKVAIRIHLGRNFGATKGFWTTDDSSIDFRGKPLTNYYDNNHFSFAHQPSLEKAKDFVREVAERYKNLQKNGKMIYISVSNTPQHELGYAYQNQQWPEKEYMAIFDHSKWSMIKFRDFLKEKYTTIRTLNSYWGTAYKNFGEPEPYINWGNAQDSFRGQRGKDWYIFRHLMMRDYYEQMISTIKGVEPTYKVAAEYGGLADNLSLLRGTFGFKDLSRKADFFKIVNDGFQRDFGYNNHLPNQKFYAEVAFFDMPTSEDLVNYVKKNAEYGCEMMVLLVEYDNGKDFEKILPAVKEATRTLNSPPPTILFKDSVTYRLSQLIDNREFVFNDWKNKSENGNHKIKIKLDEDILNENKKIENPLPDIIEVVPTTPTPPIIPPKQDNNVPNQLPIVLLKDYTKEIVVNQNFQFRIPENLFFDTDGFISFIEILESPAWVGFNRFEVNFQGKAPYLGKFKIKVKVYDNNGGSIESYIYLDIIPPVVDLELIKGDYFDVPIEPYGYITNNRVLYLDALPEKLNILARCNLDSVNFVFDITGPYRFKGSSDKLPYNVFGEGRGAKFPVGNYTLSAKAYKRDSVITSKIVNFSVKASLNNPNSNIINDWTHYPNPFQQICNIKIPETEDIEKLSFAYYSMAGKKQPIKKEYISIVEKTAYIDLGHADISAGNYILEISRGTEVIKTIKVSKNN